MSATIDEFVRQRSRERANRRAQRLLARQTGKNVVLETIDEIIKDGAPDWFTGEQASAWLEELVGQRRRVGGPPARTLNKWNGLRRAASR